MTSIVPSRRPARTAATSSALRRGGLTLQEVSKPFRASSVSSRYWGAVSAVTRTPRSRACRRMRTAPAELTWQMWTEVPTYSAIRMSRMTMMSSEMVGIPGMPSSVETSPSFMRPPFESCQSSQ